MNIRIGTRGSKLALWQANYISDLLKKGGIESEIITIETKGDKILDVSIAKIGSKGVFTEEIEDQLAQNTIDIAVHSAKDMQSVLPSGFQLLAFTEREEVNDVILSHKKGISLTGNLVLGTSSTRRIAFLKKLYPHIKTVPVRGNLQTRIRKMKEGACDALVLAYAGAHRMGYDHMIVEKLATEHFIPAVGQGSVAVECSTNLVKEKKQAVRDLTNNLEAEVRLIAERAYLRKLEGGCSIPIFALATIEQTQVHIKGGIISLNGKDSVNFSSKSSINIPEEAGEKLAELVLNNGGSKILKEIKEQLK